HFVAFADGGGQRLEDRLLSAGSDDHAFRRAIDAEVAAEVQRSRLLQPQRAGDRRVLGRAGVERLLGRLDDMRRGGEIGLADRERDLVASRYEHLCVALVLAWTHQGSTAR